MQQQLSIYQRAILNNFLSACTTTANNATDRTHKDDVEVRPAVYGSLWTKSAHIEVEGRDVVVDLRGLVLCR